MCILINRTIIIWICQIKIPSCHGPFKGLDSLPLLVRRCDGDRGRPQDVWKEKYT